MKPLSWKLLLIPILVTAFFGYLICYFLLVSAYAIPQANWLNGLLFLGLSIILLYLGWGVRTPENGKARYRGTVALRIAQAAVASAWTAAIMLGWYVGISLPLLAHTVYFARFPVLIENLLVAITTLIFLGSALLTEYWCRLDDDDETPVAANPTPAQG
ncbi:DUF3180 domain-containing protein [Gleimia sp. 6138-11-ORH1]|uniref:DUF3180 domain-containing protein n=1 Tax=Gleimia sp. 6138-11-ORH1 TaxID=2973937 RepID=UPI002168483D|nr:DUF3180 domain-containing protein [Gleimia sp. 6138-11-ORH1]MCS4484668.1 DUF3180 domain-containing protein [Gleimia sp. 6138-11-ORH1]